MNVALDPASFIIFCIVFQTVGALVAQLTIRALAGFKPRYLNTLAAGVIGNGGAYLLGIVLAWAIARLRLNVTVLLLGLMVLFQLVGQSMVYVYFARPREGRRMEFWHGFAATLCVLVVAAAVLLVWSRLRSV